MITKTSERIIMSLFSIINDAHQSEIALRAFEFRHPHPIRTFNQHLYPAFKLTICRVLLTHTNIICAGKVHGSLARAGKVRGQTPKVAKQDKPKTPKGRALKRLKYNRRFVNVGTLPSP